MKKIAFTLLLVLGSTIISCIREKCPAVEPYFQINSLDSYNLKFTNEGLNPWTTLLENDTIQWETYFIRVGFISDYIALSSDNDLSFFGNFLFALSCYEPGYKGSKIGVKNVHIITLNDFDSLYSKNDTIDSIVRINYRTYSIDNYSAFISIDEYIEQNKTSIQEQQFEFKLVSPPESRFQITQFQIIYELENGEKFETKTKEIVLRK